MPKKISPELRARAVRMVAEHREDYPSVTAASPAVAEQLATGSRGTGTPVRERSVSIRGCTGRMSADDQPVCDECHRPPPKKT